MTTQPAVGDPMVEYRDLYKAFDQPVLAGGELEVGVGRGETISVVGHSGTGKSVLLKTTIGLITPDHGDVVIEGESVFRGGRRGPGARPPQEGGGFFNSGRFRSL